MSKFVGAVIIVCLLGGLVSCFQSSADKKYDDTMGSIDWGDGYYYDSGSNSVEKTPW